MSYPELYSHFRHSLPHIKRNAVRDEVLRLSGVNKVRVVLSKLDPTVCRGMYLSPQNAIHPLAKQFGGHIIILDRSLNRCWQRFVFVKELMHLLDKSKSINDTGEKFERLLSELQGPGPIPMTEQTKSEIEAFWKTLGVFCPENVRKKLKLDLDAGHITYYGIALKLRIPEPYVPKLFSNTHENFLSSI